MCDTWVVRMLTSPFDSAQGEVRRFVAHPEFLGAARETSGGKELVKSKTPPDVHPANAGITLGGLQTHGDVRILMDTTCEDARPYHRN